MCLLSSGVTLAAELMALVYHDIVPGKTSDEYAVGVADLREQMAILKRLGYQPVSLHALTLVAAGQAVLPPKAALLSFDDGLASFRQYALPILEEYGFPAVLSLESGWLDGRGVPENYQGRILSWEDVRFIKRSPLIEIASHTDNLHHGIPSNPQGNEAPASITRRYAANSASYESETAFRRRIRADLTRFTQRMKAETRSSVNAIAWPYGYYDSVLTEEAQALGMHWQLTLGLLPARTEDFPRIPRILVYRARTPADFERLLLRPPGRAPHRILDIQLDPWSDMKETEREQRLSALLDRLEQLRIDTVVVSPFTLDGRRAFFANAGMPSTGDFFNRVLHQMRTRVGIRQIVLRLPSTQISLATYTELARRHPYDAILISDGVSAPHATALRKLFTYFRPGLECGMEGKGSVPDCMNFRLQQIQPGESPVLNADRHDAVPIYAILQNGPNLQGKQLASSMRELQTHDVRNYGLHNSAALDQISTLTGVAVELANLTDGGY